MRVEQEAKGDGRDDEDKPLSVVPSISVVIPMHDAEETIRDCVVSILESDSDVPFEVIVVDDGSRDASAEMIRGLDVRLITRERGGASAARNTGARAARAGLLLFVDADVVFYRDTLHRVYEHLRRDDVRYVSVLYSLEPLNDGVVPRYRALANYCYYYDFIFSEKEKKGPVRGETLGGGAEAFDKALFFELGGFDESVKGAGIENEILLSSMSSREEMLSDASIRTRHRFPGFLRLTRDYFSRTFAVMSLVVKRRYDEPYMNRNAMRVALGAAAAFVLLLAVAALVVFPPAFPFVLGGWLFACISYIWMHRSMFALAQRKWGAPFVVATLALNVYYCTVITVAGALGTAWFYLRRILPAARR